MGSIFFSLPVCQVFSPLDGYIIGVGIFFPIFKDVLGLTNYTIELAEYTIVLAKKELDRYLQAFEHYEAIAKKQWWTC